MKLNAKQKKILEELVKTKGSFKTATINKNDTEMFYKIQTIWIL